MQLELEVLRRIYSFVPLVLVVINPSTKKPDLFNKFQAFMSKNSIQPVLRIDPDEKTATDFYKAIHREKDAEEIKQWLFSEGVEDLDAEM